MRNSNIKREYTFNQGMNTSGCQFKDHNNIIVPFESYFNRYATLSDAEELDEFSSGEIHALGNLPLMQEAYEMLGVEKVKELGYDVVKINKELSRSVHFMIQRLLSEEFGINTIFTIEQINDFLNDAFTCFNVKRGEPHYTDLMHYFYISWCFIKDSEGNIVKGIRIGEQKDLFSN